MYQFLETYRFQNEKDGGLIIKCHIERQAQQRNAYIDVRCGIQKDVKELTIKGFESSQTYHLGFEASKADSFQQWPNWF